MVRGPDMDVLKENLYRHVEALSVEIGDRHLWKDGGLERAEEYVKKALEEAGYEVERQTYTCYGRSVSNLIAGKRGREQGLVVVGAH
ncbi:MAG: hypothetical protein JW821_11970, partial [Deltaproteobacteria bacterium]|nr:hypothetical protein [Deltaproteobacteria bacterium]